MKIIEKFFKKLYEMKFSKNFIKIFFLSYFNKRITLKAIIKLLTSITMNEVKTIIQRTTLKKSFENNDFPSEYYKMLIFHSKKKKRNKNHSLMTKRLINLFNYVQKEKKISKN